MSVMFCAAFLITLFLVSDHAGYVAGAPSALPETAGPKASITSLEVSSPPPSENVTSVTSIPSFPQRSARTVFLVVLWVLIAVVAKLVLRSIPLLGDKLPECCVLLSLGLAAGLLVRWCCPSLAPSFGSEDFFVFMLPPVLLRSSYCVPDRLVYANLTTVLVLAVAGTGLFTLALGTTLWLCPFGVDFQFGEALLFAVLLSSTDATIVLAALESAGRHDTLRALLFGESLINSVVALVMYNTYCTFYSSSETWGFLFTDHFVGPSAFFLSVAGGLLLGTAWAFFVWFLTRFTAKHHEMEPLMVLIVAYLAYLNARIFDLSGSIALTAYGVGCKTYVAGNLGASSVVAMGRSIRVISGLAESVVYLFIGLSVFWFDHVWNTYFVVTTVFFCIVYRAGAVRVLISIINIFRANKINSKEALVIGCSGLRGSVAFALAAGISEQFVAHKSLFSTTALVLVYFSVYVQGATIKPIVNHLEGGRKSSSNVAVDQQEKPKNLEVLKSHVPTEVAYNTIDTEISQNIPSPSAVIGPQDDFAKVEQLFDKVVTAVRSHKL